MKTKVTLQIELNNEHDNNKTLEEVQGFAYWLLQPFLEDKTYYDFDDYRIKEIDLKVY